MPSKMARALHWVFFVGLITILAVLIAIPVFGVMMLLHAVLS